jgi:hypothetical protein
MLTWVHSLALYHGMPQTVWLPATQTRHTQFRQAQGERSGQGGEINAAKRVGPHTHQGLRPT